MNNIKKAFKNGKALMPFITCGDPSLDITEQLVYAMEEAGANLIQLGIPFSDPTAESATIQAASLRALTAGVTTDKIFDMVQKIRQKTNIPLVFMTYANVVFRYGSEKFISKAAELNVDGLILPDLPFEEKLEFLPLCKQYNVDLISLIAPTSHERISMIAKEADGFIYCISPHNIKEISAMVELVKKEQNIPCAIISDSPTSEQLKEIAKKADGMIIDSAIVKICEKYGKDCVKHVADYIREMKQAII